MCNNFIGPIVQSVCSGINCAVLAYGQTGSGKTYTMGVGKEQLELLQSGNPEAANDLIIPYAVRQLFKAIAANKERVFTVCVSFVEVYMEKYYDLLAARNPVCVKTSADGEVLLVGAQLREVSALEQVVQLLQVGGLARVTKGTNQNDRSSRSHAVLTIHVHSRSSLSTGESLSAMAAARNTSHARQAAAEAHAAAIAANGSSGTNASDDSTPTAVDAEALNSMLASLTPLSAKLHLVDLAGSESVGRAGTVGAAAKEGNMINTSLMTLRNLIQMLASSTSAAASAAAKASSTPGAPAAGSPTPVGATGPRLVLPYRDSKLTLLLRDALGGNSSTLFIACVSPADVNAAMTVSTLDFATTARKIKTKPNVNMGPASGEVLELQRIITRMRAEIEALHAQIKVLQERAAGSSGSGSAPLTPGRCVPLLPACGEAGAVALTCSPVDEEVDEGARGGAGGGQLPQTLFKRCGGAAPAHGDVPAVSDAEPLPLVDNGDLGTYATAITSPSYLPAPTPSSAPLPRQQRHQRQHSRGSVASTAVGSSQRLRCVTSPLGAAPQLLDRHSSFAGTASSACVGSDYEEDDADRSSTAALDSELSFESSALGHDQWQTTIDLQRRAMMLESENQLFKKHVGHLSAVIGDLRCQLDEAHSRLCDQPLASASHPPSSCGADPVRETHKAAKQHGALAPSVPEPQDTPVDQQQQQDKVEDAKDLKEAAMEATGQEPSPPAALACKGSEPRTVQLAQSSRPDRPKTEAQVPVTIVTWVDRQLASAEAQLEAQQQRVQDLLQGLGLGGGTALPSQGAMTSFASSQMASLETELTELAAQQDQLSSVLHRSSSMRRGAALLEAAGGPPAQAPGAVLGELDQCTGRIMQLYQRQRLLLELQRELVVRQEQQAVVDVCQELQRLVQAYAGLQGPSSAAASSGGASGTGQQRASGGGVAPPSASTVAAARCEALAQQQLAELRQQRLQQVQKEAAVARERLREVQDMARPPMLQHIGGPDVVAVATQTTASGSWPPVDCVDDANRQLRASTGSFKGSPSLLYAFIAPRGHRRGASTGPAADLSAQSRGSAVSPRTAAGLAHSTSCSGVPLTTPAKPSPPAVPACLPQAQAAQVGQWLDALLDFETRALQYQVALQGQLREREEVYAQLQAVEQQIATSAPGGTAEAAAVATLAATACELRTRQVRLQHRLDLLCTDVAVLQEQIVDVQEAGASVARTDEAWWACVPSMVVARAALRALFDRAADLRAAYEEALARNAELEHAAAEMRLHNEDLQVRMSAQALEMVATKAAALAAVAAPGALSVKAAVAAMV